MDGEKAMKERKHTHTHTHTHTHKRKKRGSKRQIAVSEENGTVQSVSMRPRIGCRK